jgi:hypothetical protein
VSSILREGKLSRSEPGRTLIANVSFMKDWFCLFPVTFREYILVAYAGRYPFNAGYFALIVFCYFDREVVAAVRGWNDPVA